MSTEAGSTQISYWLEHKSLETGEPIHTKTNENSSKKLMNLH